MIHVKQGNRSREEEKAGGRKKARRAEVRFESFAISKIQTVKRQYLFTGCSMPHQRVWSLKSFLRVSSARRNLFSSLPPHLSPLHDLQCWFLFANIGMKFPYKFALELFNWPYYYYKYCQERKKLKSKARQANNASI